MAAKNAAYWISCFGVFEGDDNSEEAERQLVAMGKRAVPALVSALGHKERGWQAAMVLHEIGFPQARSAIPALIEAVKKRKASSGWAARALGRMGQLDTLMALARSKGSHYDVVCGLRRGRPSSYACFEDLLGRGDKSLTKYVADELAPGSASYDPPAGETAFAQIAAAARSKHAILRKDAAIALGAYKDRATRKKCVAVLTPMLEDRDKEVRRLAVLALGYCKTAARPAIPAIQALLEREKVPLVRDYATTALAAIR